ncbi:MAG: competence/damage-inducible protein A [Pyrinomonadaceae bacterium]
MQTAEIIAIGSELLTPDRTDTNSLWLTARLNELGIEVLLKTIVGDDEARLEEVIRDAVKRSDLVITTGGLGPTEDDITRPVAARALGRELVYHDEIEDQLRERFSLWGREMPEINKRQAYVIEGAEILPNPNGSAVGMLIETDGRTIAIFPGPPREMQPMFSDHVWPRLAEKAGGLRKKRRVLKVSGLGESAVDEAISPIYRAFETIETSILFNRSEVEVHLTAKARSESEADEALDECTRRIVEKLGHAVFSTSGESLEEVVGRLLTERSATLSVAESCTGGLIGSRITDVAGSSRYFIEGVVSYSNDAKIRTLGVPRETIEKHGAVSAETAQAMAAGMRHLARTDYALSVTGIAGPGGGSSSKPVGTVFVGLADEEGVKTVRLHLPGDRYLVRWRSSQAALDLLRRRLLRRERPLSDQNG